MRSYVNRALAGLCTDEKTHDHEPIGKDRLLKSFQAMSGRVDTTGLKADYIGDSMPR